MSIQLADLQSQITYHVLVKNLETQFIHELSIIQHLGCKVWYFKGGYKSTFCRLKGNLIEYGTIHIGVLSDYLESKRIESYETAEQALAVLQAWADKFGYVLSALS